MKKAKLQAISGGPDASHLITNEKAKEPSPAICTIDVKPTEQKSCFLGEYPRDAKLRGFSVEIDPEPDPENSVVTHVINMGDSKKHKLHLEIANFSNKRITATVREI